MTLKLLPAEGAKANFSQKLNFIERSARTLRYHSEPTLHRQSVGEHTYGLMLLIHLLTDGGASAALLTAALLHDTPECATGDVPGPVKRAAGISRFMAELEDRVMTYYGLGIPALTEAEQFTLKLADNLEGLSFCAFELRMGNRMIQDCFRNYLDYVEPMVKAPGLGHPLYPQAQVIWAKYEKEYKDVFGE